MAFTGKKISDLTIVNSASANSRITMVQDGQTVSSPVSALGCSLKNFTDISVNSINIVSDVIAACNITTPKNIIAQSSIQAASLSSRGGIQADCLIAGCIETPGVLSAHGDIVTDNGNFLSGGINLSDIIAIRLSADKITTTVDELLQNQALSSFAPITVTLSSNKGLSAQDIYSCNLKVCTIESSNLSAVINRGACVPNLTIGLDKGLSGAIMPDGGTGFCVTSAGMIVGCNNVTTFSGGVDNNLVAGGGSPNVVLIGGTGNQVADEGGVIIGGSLSKILSSGPITSKSSFFAAVRAFIQGRDNTGVGGSDNTICCSNNSSFSFGTCTVIASAYNSNTFGGENNTICTGSLPHSGFHSVSADNNTLVAGVSNVIVDAVRSIGIGGIQNILSGHSTNNSTTIGGNNNMVLSSAETDIIGGTGNVVVSAEGATIIGGSSNTIGVSSNLNAGDVGIYPINLIPIRKLVRDVVIVGGECNQIESGTNVISIGGTSNTLSGTSTLIAGGSGNKVNGSLNTVIGGCNNIVPDDIKAAFIAGGVSNEVAESFSIVVGGQQNKISGNGSHSSIIGGTTNTIGGSGSFIGGGTSNTVIASAAFIGSGHTNVVESSGSFIGAGDSNRIPRRRLIPTDRGFSNSSIVGGVSGTLAGDRGVIGGGFGNELSGTDSVVVGGRTNLLSGNNSFIGGGTGLSSFGSENFTGGGSNNLNKGDNSVIVGGSDNEIGDSAFDATVVGGMDNKALSTNSFIGGGFGNVVCGTGGVIGGGSENTIGQCSNNTSIVGGESNTTCFATGSSFIGGGSHNTILSGSESTIVGGVSATVIGACSISIGGKHSKIEGNNQSIIGSVCSNASGESNLILGGSCIKIGDGSSNVTIVGNQNCANNTSNSTIAGGCQISIGNGVNVFVGGGQSNAVSATNSSIVGGASNQLSGGSSFIGGGSANFLSGYDSSIVGGRNNNIVDAEGSTIIGGIDNSLSGNLNTVAGSANNVVGHSNTVIGDGNVLSGVDGSMIFGSFNKMLSTNLDFIRSLSSANDSQNRYIADNINRSIKNSYIIGTAMTLAHRNTTAVNNLTSQCYIRAGAVITAPTVSAEKVFSGGVQVCTEFNETLQELVARGSDGVIGGTDVATISSPLVFGMSGMNMGRLAISGHWQRQSDCSRGGSIEQSESLLTIGGSAVCLTEKSSINEAALRQSRVHNGAGRDQNLQYGPLQVGLSSNRFIEAGEFRSCGTTLSAGGDCIQELRTGSSSISTFKVSPNVKHSSEYAVRDYECINIAAAKQESGSSLKVGNVFLSGGDGTSIKGGSVIIAGGSTDSSSDGGGDICIKPGQSFNTTGKRGNLVIQGLSSQGSEGCVLVQCMDSLDLGCNTKITNTKSITICHGQTNCLATISNSAISLGFPAGADSVFLDKNGCLLLNRDVDFSICTPVAPADRSGCDIIIEAGQAGATSSSTSQVGGNLKLRAGKTIGATTNTLTGTKGNIEILADNINLIANTVSAAGDFSTDNLNTRQLVVNRTLRDDSNTQNFVKSVSGDGKLLDGQNADSLINSSILAGKGNRVLSGSSFIGAGFRNTSFSQRGAIVAGIYNIAGSNPTWNNQLYGSDVVIGGACNRAYGGCSFVGGGFCNMTSASGTNNAVIGGYCNEIMQGFRSFIGSGNLNRIGRCGGKQKLTQNSYNAIAGGSSNYIHGCKNVIAGGTNNSILTGAMMNPHRDPEGLSFIGGGSNNTTHLGNSFIGAGKDNTLSAAGSFIGGGASNFIQSRGVGSAFAAACGVTGNTIVNGLSNLIINAKHTGSGSGARGPIRSAIVTGSCNKITSRYGFSYSDDTFIGSGCLNSIEGSCRSTILNGSRNEIRSCYNHDGGGSGSEESTIIGGCCNRIDGSVGSSILGGCQNITHPNASNSVIAGGNINNIHCFSSFIGGGTCNITCNRASFIGNGCKNVADGQCTTIVNGCGLSALNTGATVVAGKANSAGMNVNRDGTTTYIANTKYATVIGGCGNRSEGLYSTVGGGVCNRILGPGKNFKSSLSGAFGTIMGGCRNTLNTCRFATIVGGLGNCIGGYRNGYGFVGGGTYNQIIKGDSNVILGGGSNTISSKYGSNDTDRFLCSTANNSVIMGGTGNSIQCGNNNLVGAGNQTCTYGNCNVHMNGYQTVIQSSTATSPNYGIKAVSCHSVLLNGYCSEIMNSTHMFFGTGRYNNALFASCGTILNGTGNYMICASKGTILNGNNNRIQCCANNSSILGGVYNTICGEGKCNTFIAGSNITAVSGNTLHINRLFMTLTCVPSSDPGVDGIIYRSGNTLMISNSAS